MLSKRDEELGLEMLLEDFSERMRLICEINEFEGASKAARGFQGWNLNGIAEEYGGSDMIVGRGRVSLRRYLCSLSRKIEYKTAEDGDDVSRLCRRLRSGIRKEREWNRRSAEAGLLSFSCAESEVAASRDGMRSALLPELPERQGYEPKVRNFQKAAFGFVPVQLYKLSYRALGFEHRLKNGNPAKVTSPGSRSDFISLVNHPP